MAHIMTFSLNTLLKFYRTNCQQHNMLDLSVLYRPNKYYLEILYRPKKYYLEILTVAASTCLGHRRSEPRLSWKWARWKNEEKKAIRTTIVTFRKLEETEHQDLP